MSIATPAEARHLRVRIEELEEEIRQLREQLIPPLAFPLEWRLLAPEADLLAFLFARRPHAMSRERILDAVWGHCEDPPDEKILDKTIARLRAKLQLRGLDIETRWGDGYALTQKTAARLQRLFGNERLAWRRVTRA